MIRRGILPATAGAVLALLLTGCNGGAAPTAARTTAAIAPAPPAAPTSGACYRLDFTALLNPSNAAKALPCKQPHNATTVYVGHLDPLADGHLLAIDSAGVQAKVASTCRARAAARIGGTQESRRLTRLQGVWFSPTLAQGDAGAAWFRCDLVLLAGPRTLGTLPFRTGRLLDSPGALDRFGTCGTSSPADRGFQRVVCSRPHRWRVRQTLQLSPGARYLAAAATKDATARCRDIDARIASNHLRLRWSFEWPTRAQWVTGQRFGYCWTPDPA